MSATSTPTPAGHSTVPRAGRRLSLAARRSGYLVAALVNAAMLYAINAWPGWEMLPFLTSDTEKVLVAVNASIVAGLVANLAYLSFDPSWFRGLGDLVTSGFGLAALLVVWDVFPVSFDKGGFDWETLARVVLALGIAGSVIGIVAGFVGLLRGASR